MVQSLDGRASSMEAGGTVRLAHVKQFFFFFFLFFFLLTVKQDTVKTGNRILDTLWEALSG
jgi:hypothetical protein